MSSAGHTPYELVVFDFDGALADSAASLLERLTAIAKEVGVESVFNMASSLLPDADSRQLLRRIGIPLLALPEMRARLLADGVGGESVPLVAGLPALLQVLHEAGVEVGVVSARSLRFVRAALGEAAQYIGHFACGVPMLSKAERISMILHASGRAPEATLFIGDELRDLRAAEDNAIACALVAWGFADPMLLASAGAAHFIESVAALQGLLLAPTPSPRMCVLDPIAA